MVFYEVHGSSGTVDVVGIEDWQVPMFGMEETLCGLFGVVKLLAHALLVEICLSCTNLCKYDQYHTCFVMCTTF